MAGALLLPDSSFVDAPVKVRYAETDAQGVVYHAEYIVWFEVGRTEYCESAGYPYARMEAEGTLIAVVDLRATFRRPARYGDTVVVRTRLAEVSSRSCVFRYEVKLPDGSLAVEGETRHLFLDRSGKVRTAPVAIRDVLVSFARG